MDNKKLVKSWRRYVGRRVLVNWYMDGGSLTEVTVVEVSPRGRVKFRQNGVEWWETRDAHGLVEVLPETQTTWDNRDNRMAYPQSSAAVQPETTPLSMDSFFKSLPADWCLLKVEPMYKGTGYYAAIWDGEEQREYRGEGDTPSEALSGAVAAARDGGEKL